MAERARAHLVLEDGTVFAGVSVGAEGFCFGEVVFNTSMTGYQEILTTPRTRDNRRDDLPADRKLRHLV